MSAPLLCLADEASCDGRAFIIDAGRVAVELAAREQLHGVGFAAGHVHKVGVAHGEGAIGTFAAALVYASAGIFDIQRPFACGLAQLKYEDFFDIFSAREDKY